MLKFLPICVALVAAGVGSVNAQEREALLQKIEVPGGTFDIVLAKPKSPAAFIDVGMSPEALVIHLIGGELAVSFDSADKMLTALDSLQLPACAFDVQSKHGKRQPTAVYVVPKGDLIASSER